ncbi:hypothetical protein MKW92_023593, partial [Papaver armeniacum]
MSERATVRKNSEVSNEENGGNWTVVKRKKGIKSNDREEVLQVGKQSCKIEAKTISIEKGFGSKEGYFYIKEVKGESSAALWVSAKGFSWIYSTLHSEISKEWSKMAHWEHIISGEWLMAARGKNKNGEYFKVSGPNKKGGISDLFFPSGKNLEGWLRLVKMMELMHQDLKEMVVKPSASLNERSKIEKSLSLDASFFNEGGLDNISWNQMI